MSSLLIGICIGMLANMIGGFSGWKQGTAAVLLCLALFFIHLYRLYQCFVQILHVCLYSVREFLYRIWTSSTTEAEITYDADRQSISTRF